MNTQKHISISSLDELIRHAGDLAQEQTLALTPTEHGKITYATLLVLYSFTLESAVHELSDSAKLTLQTLHEILTLAGLELSTTIIKHD